MIVCPIAAIDLHGLLQFVPLEHVRDCKEEEKKYKKKVEREKGV